MSNQTHKEILLDNILNDINTIMWEAYMVKDKTITTVDADKIMSLLEKWATQS